jgi:uncharacterized PurR-regulated membrane protein YhhQ (DUF165 family)
MRSFVGRRHGRGAAVRAIDIFNSNVRTNVPTRRGSVSFDGDSQQRSAVVSWSAYDPTLTWRASYWPHDVLVMVSRLYFPISFLTLSLAAIYYHLDRTLPVLADHQAPWLTLGHVLLPATFLLVQLTNRRYGPDYAFAQIVISLALCDVVAALGPDFGLDLLPAVTVSSAREVIAFSGAFMAAGYVSTLAFDAVRGPRWWTAPLIGSLVSSLAFALLYYPIAYAGSGAFWYQHMTVHAGILVEVSILCLFPYWLLRAVIRPLPGFGGY